MEDFSWELWGTRLWEFEKLWTLRIHNITVDVLYCIILYTSIYCIAYGTIIIDNTSDIYYNTLYTTSIIHLYTSIIHIYIYIHLLYIYYTSIVQLYTSIILYIYPSIITHVSAFLKNVPLPYTATRALAVPHRPRRPPWPSRNAARHGGPASGGYHGMTYGI